MSGNSWEKRSQKKETQGPFPTKGRSGFLRSDVYRAMLRGEGERGRGNRGHAGGRLTSPARGDTIGYKRGKGEREKRLAFQEAATLASSSMNQKEREIFFFQKKRKGRNPGKNPGKKKNRLEPAYRPGGGSALTSFKKKEGKFRHFRDPMDR